MTKKSLLLIACVCLALFAAAQNKSKGGAKVNWKKVNVLVYTKNGNGYVHENRAAGVAAIQQLANQYGFSVTVSENPADFTEYNLKKYSLIVFNNTNNDVFDTDEQKVALMRYVQAGGGFVGIHSVTGTERNWPWFKRLVGGTFVKHAKHQKFKEIVIDPNHPSTSFLPRIWERDDECYYVKEVNPDLHVLVVHDLSSVEDTDKPTFYGETFPSVWCHQFDGGRQWYTSLGHDIATYATAEFQQHIMGGIIWVVDSNKPLDYSKARAASPGDPLPY
ncbi:ThuA domain-containing protein [Agriterribacter sp.]|uniref:ThuA domain-containing protein n=1 Tax=Agriterribacter sp. TaxID=2821509 RepID=UPI002B545E90|nr:ThuA domain-containing protein [Agriterribacter sp.]HRO46268.1 ThuA domain-containing protein [Agriterribacter sp.]HRQ18509.1 ThuA domain-containing protein [Agriterribacter sp.]